MPSWVVPSDSHVINDGGHVTDHNAIADDLTLINAAAPVVSGGLTGAGAATRYAGATTSGAPASGTFAKGDFVVDQSGSAWVCSTAGTPGTWAQLGGGMSNPMTTKGDIIVENGTPAPARLAVGAANNVLGVSGGSPAWQLGMTQQAVTAAAGYTLVNGTGTIITWTAPNDSANHYAMIGCYLRASSTMTGGNISLAFTDPGGNAITASTYLSGGLSTAGASFTNSLLIVEANTAVTIAQATALTGGAAKCFAQIWGC